jgi:hypothetical protein
MARGDPGRDPGERDPHRPHRRAVQRGGKELGDRLFHDFAGWMMMPIALVVLWLGLKLLDWVLVDDPGKASREVRGERGST